MAVAKWIGAFLGSLGGGILGALAGYAIGSLIDNMIDGNAGQGSSGTSGYSRGSYGPSYGAGSYDDSLGDRNGFLFSLMVLSAHMIQADGKIMHSEMEFVRQFLRANFGEGAVQQGNQILLRLFEYRKKHGDAQWQREMQQACSEIRRAMPEEHRLQLVAFLGTIAKADGRIDPSEITTLRSIVQHLGLSASVVDQVLSLGGTTLEDAYKVLGISPDATNDEVKRAYRKMAMQYHPDRVATLGDDVKEAATKKFQEINEAKERIYKERGIKG